jgi:hypothetical protein
MSPSQTIAMTLPASTTTADEIMSMKIMVPGKSTLKRILVMMGMLTHLGVDTVQVAILFTVLFVPIAAPLISDPELHSRNCHDFDTAGSN